MLLLLVVADAFSIQTTKGHLLDGTPPECPARERGVCFFDHESDVANALVFYCQYMTDKHAHSCT